MRIWCLGALVSVFLSVPSMATTWAITSVDDPFSDTQCIAHEIVSYGSYIYGWPSKYDAVYWPYTEWQWIWVCPTSRYVSFGDDFEELNDEERSRIAEALAAATIDFSDDGPIIQVIDHLEMVYRLRDKDDEFWAWFYRVLAYWHDAQETGRGDAYRALALEIIERRLPDAEPSFDLIQDLYLAGEYHRRLGDIELARDYFQRARSIEWVDEDGESRIGAPYWNEIIDEREALIE